MSGRDDVAVTSPAGDRRTRGFGVTSIKDWLELLTLLFLGLVAAVSAIATLFYQRLGVTTEDVGIGFRLGGAVVVAALTVGFAVPFLPFAYVTATMWLGLVRRVEQIRGAAEEGRRTVRIVAYLAFWAAVTGAVVSVVPVLAATRDRGGPTLGTLRVSWNLIAVLGYAALWYALAVAYGRWFGVGSSTSREAPLKIERRSSSADRRRARRLAVALALVTSLGLTTATLAVVARADVDRVREGHPVSRWIYRATAVRVSPLGEAGAELTEAMSHCLLYLGQADGVTVLYDADIRSVVRLPTASLLVIEPQPGATVDVACTSAP